MRRTKRGYQGFSLVELLAAATIVGLLATVAVPLIETTVKRQKETELRTALRDIREALDNYHRAGVAKRIAVDPDKSGYPRQLGELAVGVADISAAGKPPVYFLRRIPRDPFNPDLSLTAVDTWRKRSFSSEPDNPQEGDDVFDVYSTSGQSGLNGVPYAEW